MKPFKILLFAFLSLTLVQCKNANSESENTPNLKVSDQEFYQLKIYSFFGEKQQNKTDDYLKEAYLPALKRFNINQVGVFKNRLTEKDSIRKTYVLIPFSNLDEFANLETTLEKDSLHLKSGANYINALHNERPYKRIESILLSAFTDMPKMKTTDVKGERSERVYELRSYESPTTAYYKRKVHMFNEGGEIKLFKRLNFNAIFYADVISGPKMPNLMYMTTFPNMTVRDSLWKEFVDSPEWSKLKVIPKYQQTVSHADIMLLYPTEYSDY
ncbi:NIPSNAP family protein [Seonamhaeicola maritimus]|uniref:NIPSNAP family protein n=1 Tax=Seonamhaeicola maritimus TaxID=2591822 RepID=UPI002494B06C|nr:NIPSNAP family protein [Seonamhaeicola maritimus]